MSSFWKWQTYDAEGKRLDVPKINKAQAALNEATRQKVIAFKNFFGSDFGKAVMLDLMNKFYILTPLPTEGTEFEKGRAEGKRDAVLYLLGQAHMDMARFDKVLKGDFE